tara:strand:- start:49 stop:372 length:324 start_codon:yes stop_codon:yes gene_type:complete
MAVVGAIAAIGTTIASVSAANEQRKIQKKQLEQQRRANEQALTRAEEEKQRSEMEYNRANRQNVDVESALDASKLSTKQGASGTLLTGSMGVNPEELDTSKNTLLGG